MEAKEDSKFMEKIAGTLRKAATELEEFQVQAALGKAEAKDKYEEVKGQFDTFLHEAKTTVGQGEEKLEDLRSKIEALRVQLALGKAESLEHFQDQKKKIVGAIHDLEVKIKTNEKLNKAHARTLIEMDKFKVKLEILEDKFREGKRDVREVFDKGKEKLHAFIDKLNPEKDDNVLENSRWEHFQDEISDAFSHLRNAFSKP